jgi:hypothetical protein
LREGDKGGKAHLDVHNLVRNLVVEPNLELILPHPILSLEESSSLTRPPVALPITSNSRARHILSNDLVRSLHLIRYLLDLLPILLTTDRFERVRGQFGRGGVRFGSWRRFRLGVTFASGGKAEGLEDGVSDGSGERFEVRGAGKKKEEGQTDLDSGSKRK